MVKPLKVTANHDHVVLPCSDPLPPRACGCAEELLPKSPVRKTSGQWLAKGERAIANAEAPASASPELPAERDVRVNPDIALPSSRDARYNPDIRVDESSPAPASVSRV